MVKNEKQQTVHCSAQEPTVNSKSFVEKLFGLFTYTFGVIKLLFVKQKDVVYVNPEISIEFKRDTIGVFSYLSDGRTNARLTIILPEDCTKLNHFRQTPCFTELSATYMCTGNHIGMPNLGSTTNVPQTTTNSGSTQTETSMPDLSSSTRNVHQTVNNPSVSAQTETNVLAGSNTVHLPTEHETISTVKGHDVDVLAGSDTVHQPTEHETISTVKVKDVDVLAGSNTVHQPTEHETISTVKVKDVDVLAGSDTVYQPTEHENISTVKVKDVEVLAGSNTVYQPTEHDAISRVKVHNILEKEGVLQSDEYGMSSTQSETDVEGSISRLKAHVKYANKSIQSQNVFKENKRRQQRTRMVPLKWNKTTRFVLNENKVVHHTAIYHTEGFSYSKDPCRLFINECGLFSGAAFRHLFKNSSNIFGRWSLLSLSKSENHLFIERIDDLPPTMLYQIAEPLQNNKDGKQRTPLEDIYTNEHRAKHQESELRRKSPTNTTKGDLNIDNDIETANIVSQNLESYIPEERISRDTDVETDDKILHNLDSNIPEEQITLDTDVEKDDNVPHNLDSNIPEEQIPHDQLQTVPNKKKQTDEWWMDRIKMKQAKVKTRSRPPSFKIYVQSRVDEVGDAVNDYFRDDIIRQCVHDFLEGDVNHTKKGDFDRPHIQWPSMHPRLPYKLRYLDEHVQDSASGNQDNFQRQNFSSTASGEYNEESSSDSISVKSDSSDDEAK